MTKPPQTVSTSMGACRQSPERVVIAKRGRPVAVLTPMEPEASAVRDIHGFMRGTVVVPRGFDLTANGDRLAPASRSAFVEAGLVNEIFVSPVSAWEIGMLSKTKPGRNPALQFLPDPKTWFAWFIAGRASRRSRSRRTSRSMPRTCREICMAMLAIA